MVFAVIFLSGCENASERQRPIIAIYVLEYYHFMFWNITIFYVLEYYHLGYGILQFLCPAILPFMLWNIAIYVLEYYHNVLVYHSLCSGIFPVFLSNTRFCIQFSVII